MVVAYFFGPPCILPPNSEQLTAAFC